MMPSISAADIWKILDEVKDPEIPVISVVEMGIVREVIPDADTVTVYITPTFSGCPALVQMQEEIRERILQAGFSHVVVEITHDPPWSSDFITDNGRQKLKKFGLAPPPIHGGNFELALLDVVRCPYCDSENTDLKNSFGATLCRAIFFCRDCRQPFEQFKPL